MSLRRNLVPHHFRAIRLEPNGDTVKISLRGPNMTQGEKVTPLVVGVDMAKVGGKDESAAVIRQGTRVVLGVGSGGPAVIDRDWINGLNAGRKPEREILALALETIAKVHGAKIVRREEPANPGFRGQSIGLRIALNGVGAMVNIDDLHGGTHGLIHWHNDYSEGNRECRDLTARFKAHVRAFGGGSSHKATTGGADWNALALCLDAGLLLASRGEAFE
jgi:hypothetical protein